MYVSLPLPTCTRRAYLRLHPNTCAMLFVCCVPGSPKGGVWPYCSPCRKIQHPATGRPCWSRSCCPALALRGTVLATSPLGEEPNPGNRGSPPTLSTLSTLSDPFAQLHPLGRNLIPRPEEAHQPCQPCQPCQILLHNNNDAIRRGFGGGIPGGCIL